jgi:hypothetical protein
MCSLPIRPQSYPVFSLLPGIAVGAGRALTGGVNMLPAVGLMDFSVGAGISGGAGAGMPGLGGGVVVVVVVVVVVGASVGGGACEPLPPQLASVTASPVRTAMPATARPTRADPKNVIVAFSSSRFIARFWRLMLNHSADTAISRLAL